MADPQHSLGGEGVLSAVRSGVSSSPPSDYRDQRKAMYVFVILSLAALKRQSVQSRDVSAHVARPGGFRDMALGGVLGRLRLPCLFLLG